MRMKDWLQKCIYHFWLHIEIEICVATFSLPSAYPITLKLRKLLLKNLFFPFSGKNCCFSRHLYKQSIILLYRCNQIMTKWNLWRAAAICVGNDKFKLITSTNCVYINSSRHMNTNSTCQQRLIGTKVLTELTAKKPATNRFNSTDQLNLECWRLFVFFIYRPIPLNIDLKHSLCKCHVFDAAWRTK